MPVYGAGIGSRAQLSTLVILNTQQPATPVQKPTCNRTFAPNLNVPVNSRRYRYYRLNTTSTPNGAGVALMEMDLAVTASGVDTTPGQTYTASSYYIPEGDTPDRAFDDTVSVVSYWASDFVSLPQWLRVDYGPDFNNWPAVNELGLVARIAGDEAQAPGSFTLDGSDDASAWFTLLTQTGVVFTSGERKTFQVTNAGPAMTVLGLAPGSYTIIGTAVGLKWGHSLPITPGSYSITGTAVGLAHGYRAVITPGAYTLSGQAVALKWAHRLPVNVGAYTLNGQTVGLLHGYRDTITPGAYVLTGAATGLLWKHSLPVTPGAYAITGTATALKWGHRVPLTPGAYAITGTPAGLLWGHRTIAVPGAYALTGTAVGLRQNRVVTIAVGAYTLNGQAVATLLGRRLTAAVGAYVLAGQSVGLTKASNTTTHAAPGAYLLTGQSVALFITHRLTATPGRYNYYGYPVTLRLVRTRFIPNNTPADGALVHTLAPGAASVAVAALPHMPPSVVGAATVPPPNAFVRATAPAAVILE